jgi:hypothetical protein
MKIRDYLLFIIWTLIPIIIIANVFLVGCTPVQLKEAELIAEGVEEADEAVEYFIKKEESHKKVVKRVN